MPVRVDTQLAQKSGIHCQMNSSFVHIRVHPAVARNLESLVSFFILQARNEKNESYLVVDKESRRYGGTPNRFLSNLGFPRVSEAQWKMVLNDSLAPSSFGYATIYFIDLPGSPRIGFVSTDGPAYKTIDGGFTWHVTSGIDKDVWGWTFKDSLTGWTATQPVYKTTDGGETWFPQPIPPLGGGPDGIYFDSVSDGLFLSASPELVSWDEGSTWQQQPSRGGDGAFAFANGDTGIECGGYDGNSFPMVRTIDAGHTWQDVGRDTVFELSFNVGGKTFVDTITEQLIMDSDCYQPLTFPGTSTYFICTPLGTVMRSDDAGVTWRNLYTFSHPSEYLGDAWDDSYWNTGSTICGNVNDLYVATLSGSYHSTDTGHTWNYLCGMPSWYMEPFKFYAKGHTVFLQTDSLAGYFSKVWRLNLDSMQYFPTGIAFTDGTKRTTTTAGNQITVNYALNGNDTIGIDTGHLVFHYDPNELILENLQLPPSWVILDSSTNNGVLNLTIAADSNAMLPTPIIQLMFGTYLSNNSAKVYLDSANLSGHRLNCGCEALSMTGSDSVQINFEGCGDSLILAAMNDSLPFYITNIAPNPASSTIEINLSSSALVAYTLFDALGRSVLSNSTSASSFSLDVSNVPSGIYYLRVASNNYVQLRSISITR